MTFGLLILGFLGIVALGYAIHRYGEKAVFMGANAVMLIVGALSLLYAIVRHWGR